MWWNLHNGIAFAQRCIAAVEGVDVVYLGHDRGFGAVGPGASVPLRGYCDSLPWAVEPVGVAGVDGGGAGEDDGQGS